MGGGGGGGGFPRNPGPFTYVAPYAPERGYLGDRDGENSFVDMPGEEMLPQVQYYNWSSYQDTPLAQTGFRIPNLPGGDQVLTPHARPAEYWMNPDRLINPFSQAVGTGEEPEGPGDVTRQDYWRNVFGDGET